MRPFDIFRRPLVAIDVGTATTRVSFGGAVPLEHPSAVREELGGTRSVMRGGVVADIAGVASVVERLLARRLRRWRRRPAALICAPSDASAREREALVEAVAAGGASVVSVVLEPLAAAIGAGVDLTSEYATVVVDIGDGVTDIAVLRSASVVFSDAKRIGCSTLRAAIHDSLDAQLSDVAVETLVRAYCERIRLRARTTSPSSSILSSRRSRRSSQRLSGTCRTGSARKSSRAAFISAEAARTCRGSSRASRSASDCRSVAPPTRGTRSSAVRRGCSRTQGCSRSRAQSTNHGRAR